MRGTGESVNLWGSWCGEIVTEKELIAWIQGLAVNFRERDWDGISVYKQI